MKKIYLKFLVLFVIASCSDERVDNSASSIENNVTELKATFVDGRLHFENKEDFKTSIEHLKSIDENEVKNLMYQLYNKGFEPLYPFYEDNDEERIKKFVEKKTKRNNPINYYRNMTEDEDPDPDAYIEPDDDLIGDDYFASLLNFDREVVIDGKLHKYTNEGVFRVDLNLKSELDTYIIENNITELNFPDPDTIEKGLVQVTPTIERYSRLMYLDPCDTFIAEPGFGDDVLSDGCYYHGGGGTYNNP